MKSPLDPQSETEVLKTIPFKWIATIYQRRYGLDVYEGLTSAPPEYVQLHRCMGTGYEFFTPAESAGSAAFYAALQRFPWYYVPWKWEHQVSLEFIDDGASLLEVGCGVGHFLNRLGEFRTLRTRIGLELNEGVHQAPAHTDLRNETVQTHALTEKGVYDVVCAFQVLEHISDVRSFLGACCDCLRVGGTLILSVPNNDALIRYDARNVLNMPPHHMGRWRRRSLGALTNHFPLELVTIREEPLNDASIPWIATLAVASVLGYHTALTLRRLRFLGLRRSLERYIVRNRERFTDHTILAAYRKRAG